MRKLLRSIARHNMKKAGVEQLNKKTVRTEKGARSKFSLYWRQYITPQPPTKKRKVKSNKATPTMANASC